MSHRKLASPPLRRMPDFAQMNGLRSVVEASTSTHLSLSILAVCSDRTVWEWGLLGSMPRLDTVDPYLWPHNLPLR